MQSTSINSELIQRVLVDPAIIPILFRRQPSDKDDSDLGFDDVMLHSLRQNPKRIELDAKSNKNLLSSVSYILTYQNQKTAIRSILVIFAMSKVIDIYPYFTNFLSADCIHYDQYGNADIDNNYHYIFNDLFYHNIDLYPDLKINIIESIYEFIKKCSLQYETVYPIINRIINDNEISLCPIESKYLSFMEESSVNDNPEYKQKIQSEYPIILPYSIRIRDYLNEPQPAFTTSLIVNRNHILDIVFSFSSFNSLLNSKLHIQYEGESGVDCGGLCRQFIDQAFKEIVNPRTGLFIEIKEQYWFNYIPNPTNEQLDHYKCVGILFALCLKNQYVISIRFPRYFYKKLLHKEINMHDLALYMDKRPYNVITESLMSDVNELDLPYSLCYHYIKDGEKTDIDIDLSTFKELDDDTPDLTNENKGRYLGDAIEFIFNKSIENQWNAFEEGFKLIDQSPLLYNSFTLEEIDIIASGEAKRDWKAFQENTSYEVGTNPNATEIKWFWEIFNSYDEKQKNNFVRFVTGTSAFPIDGIQSLKLTIYLVNLSHGIVSHTCFKRIDLPRYRSKEEMAEMLDVALSVYDQIGFNIS